MAVYFKGDTFPKLIEGRKHTRAFSPLFSTSLPPPPFQVSKWQTPTECTYMMITSFYKLDREKNVLSGFGGFAAGRTSTFISGIDY